MSERVVENLNRALHSLLEDDRVFFLGEDILDPYGGAFKVSRGLSTRFPERVISTPISELGIAGVANGLALAGQRPILEFMFGDFSFLAFDQLANFAAKSVTMYGERLPFHLLARCPVGGHRGYGATHSQCVQKHFIGIPNLSLFELSQLHDNHEQLPIILGSGSPAILFESKTLYSQPQFTPGTLDELFAYDFLDRERQWARAAIDQSSQAILITTGGMFPSCWKAARELFLEYELEVQIVVPFCLYPFDPAPLIPLLSRDVPLFVVEESTAGGTWGSEVATVLSHTLPGANCPPIHLIHSKDAIIPAARHLEREVLVQPDDIVTRIHRELQHASHRRSHH